MNDWNDDQDAGYGVVPRHLRGHLTAYEIAVYVALSWRINAQGECYLRHRKLADEAGCSLNTVKRSLDVLKDKGIVDWWPKFGDDGSVVCNVYRLNVTPAAQSGRGVAHTGLGGSPDGAGGSPTQGYRTNHQERTTRNEHTPSPATPTTATDGALWVDGGPFQQFWAAYPRKVGKQAAYKAWRKAVLVELADVILSSVHRLASDPNLPEKRFIPHPATWLNEGRWSDDPYPPRKVATTTTRVSEAMAVAERMAVADGHAPGDPWAVAELEAAQ